MNLLVEIKAGVSVPMSLPNERKLCENNAVNAVAGYYLGLAESQGVAFDAQLDIPEDSGSVPAMDLCVIMGDLLGNALDNCRMAQENKFTRVISRAKGNYLSIEVISSSGGQRQAEEGVGLSTVKALCVKHRGSLEEETSGTQTKVLVLVQIKTAKDSTHPETQDDMEAVFLAHGLSRREIDVANLMIFEGLLAKDIGQRLFISTPTVNEHFTNIYRKFGVKRRPEFMALFVNVAEKPGKR
jgi:DNA-binding CsgD family transcriptional regulator